MMHELMIHDIKESQSMKKVDVAGCGWGVASWHMPSSALPPITNMAHEKAMQRMGWGA
jgi:hypothetical protein